MKDLLQPIRDKLCSADRWTKGQHRKLDYLGNARAYCLAGAVLYSPDLSLEESANVQYEIGKRVRSRGGVITTAWNDDLERTFEDIQELLKEPFYG